MSKPRLGKTIELTVLIPERTESVLRVEAERNNKSLADLVGMILIDAANQVSTAHINNPTSDEITARLDKIYGATDGSSDGAWNRN